MIFPNGTLTRQIYKNFLNAINKQYRMVTLGIILLLISTSGILAACEKENKNMPLKQSTNQTMDVNTTPVPIVLPNANDDFLPSQDTYKTIYSWTSHIPGTIYSCDSSRSRYISYYAGNFYSLDEKGNVLLFYRNGSIRATAPLTLYNDGFYYHYGMQEYQAGFYISEEKTAIVYSDFDSDNQVKILISDDMGKSWNTYTIANNKISGVTEYVRFTSKSNGWIVFNNYRGMGTEYHYIYKTTDGGKTWTEVKGNINDVCRRFSTGAGFANDDIGFLCFGEFDDNTPLVCWTEDGGKHWSKLEVTLPPNFEDCHKTPSSPIFFGKKGLLPIRIIKNGMDMGTIYLTSNDYGKTWLYDRLIS